MPYRFTITRQVEFADTDLAGIVHFANFFRYMENTEHAFYRSLGFSVVADGESGESVGWPRVHAECDYTYPLRFEDTMEIELLVFAKSTKSITYDFHFRRASPQPVVEVARGRLVVVAAAFDKATGRVRSVALPPRVNETIELAPRELFTERD